MRERLYRVVPALLGLAVFVAALEVLRRELHEVSWPALVADVFATPSTHLAAAILLTILNYAVLTAYDFIAFAYIGKQLSRRKIAITSFLAYAVANNVGFAMLSGASVRYRFYSRWGVTGSDLSRIVFSYSVTFWLGLLALGGLSLALSPLPLGPSGALLHLARPLGWALVAASVGYVIAAAVRRSPIRVRSLELPLPTARLAVMQLLVSALDWALAGAVLYVLLPSGHA